MLLFFFISHIPATLLMDLQAVVPPALVPAPLRSLRLWYVSATGDPLMREPFAPWFAALIYVEVRGTSKRQRRRDAVADPPRGRRRWCSCPSSSWPRTLCTRAATGSGSLRSRTASALPLLSFPSSANSSPRHCPRLGRALCSCPSTRPVRRRALASAPADALLLRLCAAARLRCLDGVVTGAIPGSGPCAQGQGGLTTRERAGWSRATLSPLTSCYTTTRCLKRVGKRHARSET